MDKASPSETSLRIGGDEKYVALFGHVTGEIQRLNLDGPIVKGTHAASLVGVLGEAGTIRDCRIVDTGSRIKGRALGDHDLVVFTSTPAGVYGEYFAGGLVCKVEGAGLVVACESACNVRVQEAGGAGGLICTLSDTSLVKQSRATGSVGGTISVGGLVGKVSEAAVVTGCSAAGKVWGTSFVGGLIGQLNDRGLVSDCSASGQVEGTESIVGGLIGRMGRHAVLSSNCQSCGTVKRRGPSFNWEHCKDEVGHLEK